MWSVTASETLSNGEHPLMIRLCQGRKLKYISLGISIHAQYWDFEKNKPRRNCPNKEQIQKLISDKEDIYREQVIDFKYSNKEFTVNTLVDKINSPVKARTVRQLFDAQIQHLTALIYRDLMNSLIKFNKHLDIYFSDIDVAFLKKYEAFLRSFNLKENTIGIRFRTLRALYNLAIEENIVKAEYYPFDSYKVSKLKEKTAKRSITKDNVMTIIDYESYSNGQQFAIDLFSFSYFMGGINFVDMKAIKKITNSGLAINKVIFPVIEFRMNNKLNNKGGSKSTGGTNINYHIILDKNIDINKAEFEIESLKCFGENGEEIKLG